MKPKNKYEPLRGKSMDLKSINQVPLTPVFFVADVASAVRFYKRYRVSTEHIKKNYQLGGVYNIDLWYDYPKLVDEYLDQDKAYNEWLFDYCFGDVTEKVDKIKGD